jgi:N-acetylglutamate synthase-like GNAT family acetyltransferase
VIKYEWRTSLSPTESAELADMLQRAAAYDAEPEYSTIDFADVEEAMSQTNSSVRHLLIWMLPHATAMGEADEPERIAGLLRLTPLSEGAAEATTVIDPRLRSIGITTLLLEQVGVDATCPDGWMGTGLHTVTAWARGNHPATGRLSNRFLIPRTRRVWKLIRSTRSVEEATAAPVLEPIDDSACDELGWAPTMAGSDEVCALREGGRVVGVATLELRAVDSAEFGRCATVKRAIAAPNADVGCQTRLLDGAAAAAHEAGLSGVIVYVDSDNGNLVNASRLAGFQHDRTDVRYQLGDRR